jgi:hypothetical protein
MYSQNHQILKYRCHEKASLSERALDLIETKCMIKACLSRV